MRKPMQFRMVFVALAAILFNIGLFGCHGSGSSSSFSVTSVTPENNSVGVNIDVTPIVIFDAAVDQDTINDTNIKLMQGSSEVPGTLSISEDGLKVTLLPLEYFDFDTTYEFIVGAGVTSSIGIPLSTAVSSVFTTHDVPHDTEALKISSVSPSHQSTGIDVNSKLHITFSKEVNTSTLSSENIKLSNGATDVPISIDPQPDGKTVVITPATNMDPGAYYTLTVKSEVTDTEGNSMHGEYATHFYTALKPDTKPPVITLFTPVDGAPDVAPNVHIIVAFSEHMDVSTFTPADINLKDATDTTIPVTISSGSAHSSAIVTSDSDLAFLADYTLSVSTGLTDAAGNNLLAAGSASFTTGPEPDTTPPTITHNSPADGQTEVHLDSKVIVNFSEPIDSATATSASIVLKAGSIVVPATVTTKGDHSIVTVTPSHSLKYGLTYTLEISSTVTDTAGNALTAATVSFSTHVLGDIVISGKVSTTVGGALAGVTVAITGRSETATTNASGIYHITLPGDTTGGFTLTYTKTGYIGSNRQITLVQETPLAVREISLSEPIATGFRIILNWENKTDVDSYFMGNGEKCFYSNKKISGATLDHDDTDGEGPETITITTTDLNTSSTYIYYLSRALNATKATIRIYDSIKIDGPIMIIHLPIQDGDTDNYWWHAVNLVHNGGKWTIEEVNRRVTDEPTQ